MTKAAAAIQKIKARRFSYQAIADWLMENEGYSVDRTHVYRIASGERNATVELEKALIKAAKVMK